MRAHFRILNNRARTVLRGTTLLAGIGAAFVATAPAHADDAVETVVVTGYRASLAASTDAKRASTNFTDTLFAEDIGKFPDTNIAEAFNRIPGVTIQRENDGEGLRIALRGLDTNFVKITLNGAVVSTASTGGTDQSGANREVDLNIFPIELFSQLTVSKTSTASMLEGGASGTIEMRSLRPFDNPGTHLSYNVQGTDYSKSGDPGYRGTVIGSYTDGAFGVLLGLSGQVNHPMTTGYEGAFNNLTTPNLNATQYFTAAQLAAVPAPTCAAIPGVNNGNSCNTLGGATDWSLPATFPNTGVPAAYVGQTITGDRLLALNPGLTMNQISNGLVPRTGRPMFERGDRSRYNGILSLEYRPTDDLHFYFDGILGVIDNNLDREDMFWVARNGNSIPMNEQVDTNNVVVKGNFANAAMALEARPYKEKSDYFSVNPGMEWQVSDLLRVKAQLNYSRAHFFRDSPSFLFGTPNGIVNYDNTGSSPTFSMDGLPNSGGLQNPANFTWNQGDLRLQQERRYQHTQGAHADVEYGGDAFKVAVGAAYDDAYRLIRGYDNGNYFKEVNCGPNESTYVPTPNTSPGCSVSAPTLPAFPGWGMTDLNGFGYTQGLPFPTLGAPTIPNSAIPQYLMAGPNGFVAANYALLKKVTNYNAFATMPSPGAATNLQDPGRTNFSIGTNTNISSGVIDESTVGTYIEFSGTLHRGSQNIRYNFGGRYITTDQTLTGYTSVADPRNLWTITCGVAPYIALTPAGCATGTTRSGIAAPDGARYPNTITAATLKGSYSAFLPSANIVWEIAEDFQVRAAASRTLTRANPASMLPQLSGGGSDAATWNLGNPNLRPYYSTNIDFGAELYTGGEGYIGVGVFRKMMSGFQNNFTTQQPFSYLAQFGITYDTLSTTQQQAITAAGGPNVATVNIVQARNATGLETINGVELTWVQPLDFLLEPVGFPGFGFQANGTFVRTRSSGAAPAVVLGVSPTTYNVTAYYEHDGLMLRGSYNYQSGALTNSSVYGLISSLSAFTEEHSLPYGQLDFSSSFRLANVFGDLPSDPEFTFDIQNLTRAKIGRSYKQFPNLLNYSYNPGTLFLIGFRGSF
ncbi:MAG: TonB-dependent receptor [Rhizomicrobium sp.]